MKKLFVVALMMIFSSQLFAQDVEKRVISPTAEARKQGTLPDKKVTKIELQKFIKKINGMEGIKASQVTYGEKSFLKIVRNVEKKYISEFHLIDVGNPVFIISGGYTISCVGMCAVGCDLNLAGNCTGCDAPNPCVKIKTSNSFPNDFWYQD